jgi:hypothetical protein
MHIPVAVWLQYSRRAVAGRFCSGVGYTAPIFGFVEGYLRKVENIMLFPSSEVLASIGTWPAVFFGKGLWDNYQSLEGVSRLTNALPV